MSIHRVSHGLAILSLSVVAIMNIIGTSHQFRGTPPEMRFTPLFGFVIWSLLLWKIWKQPRRWGLGVGVFLFVMIAFQTYLWLLAVADPKLEVDGTSESIGSFILYEVPICVAGVCCILLRFLHLNELKDNAP
jgi:hypothetical protein